MTFSLDFDREVVVSVGIDHGQFIVCDPNAELDIDTYDERASRESQAAHSADLRETNC